MKTEKKEFIPTIMDDYIPKIIHRIISKINQSNKENIVLFGFSDNMKLLYRILKENQINPTLCDWRNKYIEYDCGGKKLKSIDLIKNDNNTIVVCCIEEINELKSAVRHIIKNNLHDLKIIFEGLELDTSKNLAFTCGSGVTACVLGLANSIINGKNPVIYDGSWAEYGIK